MNIDTLVIAQGKESLVRAEWGEGSRFPGNSMGSSFHCHSRNTGSREIRQHWRRRGAVSKQGFELSFHTPGSPWGSKAVVVRELLCIGGKTGCSLCGAVKRGAPAGCRQILSPQDAVKERMKLYRFGVLSISSPQGQKTGPTSLHLKTPHIQGSTGNTTQGQVSMGARPASTAGAMPQRVFSLFFAVLRQTCFSITSSSFTLTGTQQRKKGGSVAPAVLSRTDGEKNSTTLQFLGDLRVNKSGLDGDSICQH